MKAAASYKFKVNTSNSQLEEKFTSLFSEGGQGGGSLGEQGGQDRRQNRGQQRMREERAKNHNSITAQQNGCLLSITGLK